MESDSSMKLISANKTFHLFILILLHSRVQ